MEQFSYSFIITMLHSTWQTALLLFVYFLLVAVHRKSSPLFKRNVLYAVLGLQLLTSLFTFSLLYSKPGFISLQQFVSAFETTLQASWLAENAIFLFYAYALVFVLRLGSLVVPWNNFKNNYRQSLAKPCIDLRLFTQTKAYHFGIRHKVVIWCSSSITSPMTFGFWKPIILLPVALVNQLSIRETEALIIHELTHIRHFDYLLNRMLVVVENIFFFNPFIHIVAQKIRIEREKNCDLQVLMFNYDQVQYAETLLKTARHQQQQLTMQMGAVKRKDQLLRRIHFFSNGQNLQFGQHRSILSTGGLLVALLINLLLVTLFIAGPVLKKDSISSVNGDKKLYLPSTPETGKIIIADAPAVLLYKMKPTVAIVPTKAIADKQTTEEPEAEIETPEDFYAMPATNAEATLYEGKEIRITDEGSDGTKITAVYQAILIEGIWTLQPLWMLSETKTAAADSLKNTAKDSVIKIYPIVQ